MTDDRPAPPDDLEHVDAGVESGVDPAADSVEAGQRAGAAQDAGATPDADWRFDPADRSPGEAAWGAAPRRLERPPSLRYSDPGMVRGGPAGPGRQPSDSGETAGGRDDTMPSGPRWAVGIGIFAALIPSVILIVFAAVFGFTAGLVVVGLFVGRIVGISVRGAPNSGLTSDARTLVAIVITLLALTLAQVAIWLLALREGGDLPLVDFLAQTYGPVVPLEVMLGTIAAWWSAR